MKKTSSLSEKKIFFYENRLDMNPIERFLIRLITYSFYSIFIAASAVFLLSDIKWLFWLGVLSSLFLIDRFFHLGQAQKSLINFRPENKQKINLVQYLTPLSLSFLERAHDKTLVANKDFFLCLVESLIKDGGVREGLLRLDVPLKEFSLKIDDALSGFKSSEDFIKDKDIHQKIEKIIQKAIEIG